MTNSALISRRRVLRGTGAVAVGLPFFDCFLNNSGMALAATGAPLPVRFGTWFWGCGLNPGRWEPRQIGAYKDLGPELMPLDRFKSKINAYSGMKVFLDGKPNAVHFSGPQCVMTGTVPGAGGGMPSIDALVAEVIGTRTRFRSIEVACTGNPNHSQSRRSGSVINAAEVSPAALYQRIFGSEFSDPNAASFTPDTRTQLRKSVLSAVAEERQSFINKLGASDRARADEYFTSLRSLEQQIALQLEKPAPLEACKMPGTVETTRLGTEIDTVKSNHKLFAGLLANALACGQTNIINIAYADATSSLRKAGGTHTHHESSHEEPTDPTLGYQPEMTWYYSQIMESFADLMAALDGIKEGDRTLLDRSVVYATTDSGFAKIHALDNFPMLSVGSAGGRLKTGMHVSAPGDTVARVGLTLQQALGASIGSYGTESNQTSKSISEILA